MIGERGQARAVLRVADAVAHDAVEFLVVVAPVPGAVVVLQFQGEKEVPRPELG